MAGLLSIRTVFPQHGTRVWYDDQREARRQIYAGDDVVEYQFMGSDLNSADNRWLLDAMQQQIPVIYFLGASPGRYQPIIPTFIVGWHPDRLRVDLAFGIIVGASAQATLPASPEDPCCPIPPEIATITGITDEMVAGHTIDDRAVNDLLGRVVLVIAHNADFDRHFLERRLPAFAAKHWACSGADIGDPLIGARIRRLLVRVLSRRASASDCRATLHVLAQTLPGTGRLALQALLEQARSPTWRLWARDASIEEGCPQGPRLLLEFRRVRATEILIPRCVGRR